MMSIARYITRIVSLKVYSSVSGTRILSVVDCLAVDPKLSQPLLPVPTVLYLSPYFQAWAAPRYRPRDGHNPQGQQDIRLKSVYLSLPVFTRGVFLKGIQVFCPLPAPGLSPLPPEAPSTSVNISLLNRWPYPRQR